MKLTSVGEVIAVRHLRVTGADATVTVMIGKPKPFPDGQDYYCPYQIRGLGSEGVRYAGGVDSVQALVMALEGIRTTLSTSQEAKAGRLNWLDQSDLGFPLPSSINDRGRHSS